MLKSSAFLGAAFLGLTAFTIALGQGTGSLDGFKFTQGVTFNPYGAFPVWYTAAEVVPIIINGPRKELSNQVGEPGLNELINAYNILGSSPWAIAGGMTSLASRMNGVATAWDPNTALSDVTSTFRMHPEGLQTAWAQESAPGIISDADIQAAVTKTMQRLYPSGHPLGWSTYSESKQNDVPYGAMALVFLGPALNAENGPQSTCTPTTCGYYKIAKTGPLPYESIPYAVIPNWDGGCTQCWSNYPNGTPYDKSLMQMIQMTIKMMTGPVTVDRPPKGGAATNVIDACGRELAPFNSNAGTKLVPKVWFMGACIPAA